MTDEHRKHFDEQKRLALAGDKKGIVFVRAFLQSLASHAPIAAIVKAIESLNDSYVNELIEWHENNKQEKTCEQD